MSTPTAAESSTGRQVTSAAMSMSEGPAMMLRRRSMNFLSAEGEDLCFRRTVRAAAR